MLRFYLLPLERIGNTRLPMYLYHGRYPERGGIQVARRGKHRTWEAPFWGRFSDLWEAT